MWRTGDQRIVMKSLVQTGILDHEDLVAKDGMCTKRHLARGLGGIQPMPRLEPLALAIDQTDQGNRRVADLGCQRGEVVVGLFLQGIENLECRQLA